MKTLKFETIIKENYETEQHIHGHSDTIGLHIAIYLLNEHINKIKNILNENYSEKLMEDIKNEALQH